MKNIKVTQLITLLVCIFGVSYTSATNYLLENKSGNKEKDPLYFDFVYEQKKPTPQRSKRSNFIKDEIVLLFDASNGRRADQITKEYGLETASKGVLASIKKSMIVAKTKGQNPLILSKRINHKEKSVDAISNNIFKPAATTFKNAYSMHETGVRFVHKTTKGKGITVCMVDTPVDIFHPSLSNATIETKDLFEVNENDYNAMLHGTSVAGVLVSQNQHIGIAPKAKLISVGAFRTKNSRPNSLYGTSSDVAKGLDTCIQQNVDVINLSFTGSKDALVEKMVSKAISKGITVVSAAGNGGRWGSSIYPALIPGVLTATAVDEEKKLFSMADKGRFIDFAAPGVNILTLAPGGKYKLATGTSISSAYVSGVVALLLSQKKSKNINNILKATAFDLGKPGRDQEYGDGLISASKALSIIKQSL